MAHVKLQTIPTGMTRTTSLVYPIVLLWGVVAIAIFTYITYENDVDGTGRYYLIPWSILTGAVIASPTIYLFYKGKFDPFHPLVFAAWIYFFPAFFVGGILLGLGLIEPYYLSYIDDEKYNLSLVFIYVILGFLGLIIGFSLPVGRRLGEIVSNWLPSWNWQSEKIPLAGIILLVIGMINTILGFTLGILGFTRLGFEERGVFDGIVYLLSLFFAEASLLLWLYVFRHKKIGATQILIIATLLLTSLARAVFQGNRGMFVSLFIIIAFAFVLSGKKISFRTGLIGGMIAFIALVFGMIYGTTFRAVKEDQSTISMDRYADVVTSTFEQVGDKNLNENLAFGFFALGERIEAVTTLGVIVSNYEKLAPYEEVYGINDNIWKDTAIFFIPRIVWPDKPVAIETGKYGDLYFNFSENSFAMTPIGDLLRNFGPYGIPLGMLVLGILIRFIYASLQENQTFSYWRATLFYMLLTAISYEGTYGLILPTLFKVGVFSIVGIVIVRFFAGSGRAASVS
jgi:hypothetical protein